MSRFLITLFFSMCVAPVQADDFVDSFASADFDGRLAERGAWKFDNRIASCVADPELYVKYKNHGPILKWPRPFNNGTVEFEMKATDCQRVVFTLNGDGHLFRFSLMDPADPKPWATSRMIAWAEKSSKENKGDTIKPKGFPDAAVINDRWVPVRLSVSGDTGHLTIGDFTTKVQHAAFERDCNMITLTFASGKIAVRGFRVSTLQTK